MKTKELLSPSIDLSLLQAKAEEVYAAIERITHNLKRARPGRLRIAQRKSGTYYFHVTDSSNSWGKYLPATDFKAITQLAQKEYDRAILTELQRELKILDRFLDAYHPEECLRIYSNMPECRKSLVNPVVLSDEEFVRQWQAVKYKGKSNSDGPLLTTLKGEHVRSKSEVIIGDTLSRLNIPYHYEYPHEITVRKKPAMFYPDFTCLNVRTRKEFIWEHFGLMDDPDYAAQATQKIEAYAANGIFLGKQLIVTMETRNNPLSSFVVEEYAKRFLIER